MPVLEAEFTTRYPSRHSFRNPAETISVRRAEPGDLFPDPRNCRDLVILGPDEIEIVEPPSTVLLYKRQLKKGARERISAMHPSATFSGRDGRRVHIPEERTLFTGNQINSVVESIPGVDHPQIHRETQLLWTPSVEGLDPDDIKIFEDPHIASAWLEGLIVPPHEHRNQILQPDVAGLPSGILDEESALANELGRIADSKEEDPKVLQTWFIRLADCLDKNIPPGAPAKAFVGLVIGLGGIAALRKGDKAPLIAAGQGLVMGLVGNTFASLLTHRVSHGSIVFKPGVREVLRFLNALESGTRPDTFVTMHKPHHANADTKLDPTYPDNFGPLGRWIVYGGVTILSRKYEKENPDGVVEAQLNPNTRRMPFDNHAVTGLGVAGTNWLLGERLHLSPTYRAIAAFIHLASLYVEAGNFAADGHPNGEATDFKFGHFMSLWSGGEKYHGKHHRKPWDPLHGDVIDDPAYALAWALKKLGLAEFPAEQAGLLKR